MYIESDRRVLHVVTKDNVYSTYGKLDEYQNRVPTYYIRCSKSYLVNKNFIKGHNSQFLILLNGEIIL